MKLLVNGKKFFVKLIETSSQRVLFEINEKNYLVELADESENTLEKTTNNKDRTNNFQVIPSAHGENTITAEISGLVHSVKVNLGDFINPGDTLLLLEAMKMQNRVISTYSGKITAIYVIDGQEITKGQELIQITS